MVAYLKKPTGSEGFQEIVDFLNGTHIRYALTKNPTIYVSLIKKFWQTTTDRTVDNREQEITTTADGKEFTVTEASVRRHLQLADAEDPIPISASSSHQKTQTPRQALQKVNELPQTSKSIPNVVDEVVYEEWDDRVERAATTTASLDVAHASGGSPRCQEALRGSIAQTRSERVPKRPYDSPLPRVNTLRSNEGSMTLQELMVLCTTLSQKVESLEADLKQTKQVYGVAYTKLIMKVKELEKTVKTSKARRKSKIAVSDDDEEFEDPSKPGRREAYSQKDQPEDQLGVLSRAKVLADTARRNIQTYTRRRAVSTSSDGVSTNSKMISTAKESVSTASASMPVSAAGMVDKERQRMARVHEAAQTFTEEEWENIRARVEADEELT
nr:hypothetical protein [Tanacetum cinerariifolium]